MCRKCPKCGHIPLFYIEVWENHTIKFEAFGDGTPEPEGYLEMGDPFKVVAHCGCGHSWTLRGVAQITELRK